jgi:hypothetical protein
MTAVGVASGNFEITYAPAHANMSWDGWVSVAGATVTAAATVTLKLPSPSPSGDGSVQGVRYSWGNSPSDVGLSGQFLYDGR